MESRVEPDQRALGRLWRLLPWEPLSVCLSVCHSARPSISGDSDGTSDSQRHLHPEAWAFLPFSTFPVALFCVLSSPLPGREFYNLFLLAAIHPDMPCPKAEPGVAGGGWGEVGCGVGTDSQSSV